MRLGVSLVVILIANYAVDTENIIRNLPFVVILRPFRMILEVFILILNALK